MGMYVNPRNEGFARVIADEYVDKTGLIALVAEHYLSPGAVHHYGFLALLGALIFGLLPFAASFAAWQRSLLLGGVGAAVLAGLAALLTSLCRRIDTGPKAPLAPVACALCLYLASQAFRGVLL